MSDLIDLTRDLRELAQSATDPTDIEGTLQRALEAMAEVIPYDLAAVLELEGEVLWVRAARGSLANGAVRSHRLRLEAFPTVRRAMETRRATALSTEHHASAEGDPYDGVLDLPDGHACMVVPLFAGERSLGAITFDRKVCSPYSPKTVELAGVYGQLVALALMLASQTAALERYRRRLTEQNRLLVQEVRGDESTRALENSQSPAMKVLVQQARLVAVSDMPVLIQGETGVGKEVLAECIHRWSNRAGGAMVSLNCAAIPSGLVESELFGHMKGAFSGATSARAGRFTTANGGTLLLDEIGDLSLEAQAKLLRVLQSGTFEPVGSDRTHKVDVRVLAASHVDLQKAVAAGKFREDLYYRLAVFPLQLPPLRERREDILPLAEQILARIAGRTGRGPWEIGEDAAQLLIRRDWPGNVRELVNALERATILRGSGILRAEEFGSPAPRVQKPAVDAGPFPTMEEAERRHIQAALMRTGGKIYGPDGAAALLELPPTTLQSRMKKLEISAPKRGA